MGRHRTRDQHERVSRKQRVAEGLLASAGNPRPQSVRIWNMLGLDQRRPIDLLATTAGVEIVENHLERIEYGVYT